MRVAKYDDAKHGRGLHARDTFREIVPARMLWSVTGLSVIGLLAGFVFYNPTSRLPVQNQTPPNTQMSSKSDTATPVPAPSDEVQPVEAPEAGITSPGANGTDKQVAANGATNPVHSTQVLGTASCQANQPNQAAAERDDKLEAENERFKALMGNRHGIKQLLSAITGTIISPPSEKEVQKHEDIIKQINTAYDAAVAASHC